MRSSAVLVLTVLNQAPFFLLKIGLVYARNYPFWFAGAIS